MPFDNLVYSFLDMGRVQIRPTPSSCDFLSNDVCTLKWMDGNWSHVSSLKSGEGFVLDRRWESLAGSLEHTITDNYYNTNIPISVVGASVVSAKVCTDEDVCETFEIKLWKHDQSWKHFFIKVKPPYLTIRDFGRDVPVDIPLHPAAHKSRNISNFHRHHRMYEMTVRHLNLSFFGEDRNVSVRSVRVDDGVLVLHDCRFKILYNNEYYIYYFC